MSKFDRADIFKLICFSLSAYFFITFHLSAGFPPKDPITNTAIFYLAIALFFFLIPSAKKLKLGKLIEFESQVKELKEETREFKSEIRQSVAIQSSLINAVSNTVNQSINISFPWSQEAQEAKEELDENFNKTNDDSNLEEDIERFIRENHSDTNYALTMLRSKIEVRLREVLKFRTDTQDPIKMKGNFLSINSLFRKFVESYPKFAAMNNSFEYVMKVCNAATHGQKISRLAAHEAFYMGLRILEELKDIEPQ